METKNDLATVPYIVYESEVDRHERTEKRQHDAMVEAEKRHHASILKMVIAFLVVIMLNNLGWLLFINQYDITSDVVTIENDENGNANYLESGEKGVINNGE